eukprot:COSAG02_NODE_1126_length_14431_cov_37.854452_25_plen_97_part_01
MRCAGARAAARAHRPATREGAPETIRGLRMHVPRLNSKIDSLTLFVTKMLAMALLLHGGLLGGVGGEAAGVDGSGEGAWTLYSIVTTRPPPPPPPPP